MNTQEAFKQLNGACAGRPAVVIGKGPTLDAWLAAGCPQAEGAVRIGVNQVAALVPDVAYSVSGDCQMDLPEYLALPTQWVRGLPYETEAGEVVETRPAAWDAHGVVDFRCVFDEGVLHWVREVLCLRSLLYCHVCSANPAVHLAWLLGCREVMLVGIDGGTARAKCLAGLPDRGGGDYDMMRRSVDRECDVLFNAKWWRWQPPEKRIPCRIRDHASLRMELGENATIVKMFPDLQEADVEVQIWGVEGWQTIRLDLNHLIF